MNSLLLAALLALAPFQPADPAPPTFPIVIDSKVQLPDGKVLSIKGTIYGTIEDAIPTPVGPTITALKNQAGQGVEQIRSGEVLILEGLQLWRQGVQLRVQLPGQVATVVSSTATKLSVRFPAVTAAVTGPLQIYHNTGSGWTLVATGPRLTLLPATTPLPVPGKGPRIRSFRSEAGEIKQVFAVGEVMVLKGTGFGPVPGEVWTNGAVSPILAWADTEIRIAGYPKAADGTWWMVRNAENRSLVIYARDEGPRVE